MHRTVASFSNDVVDLMLNEIDRLGSSESRVPTPSHVACY